LFPLVEIEVKKWGMGKISCPFTVEYQNRKWKSISPIFRSEYHEKVFKNGIPTVKFDGMNCMKVIVNGKHILLIRYDRKLNKKSSLLMKKKKLKISGEPDIMKYFKAAPSYFIPTQASPDPETFHFPGYVPIFHKGTENAKLFEEYLDSSFSDFLLLTPFTYELLGPSVNSNLHKFEKRFLMKHGAMVQKSVENLRDLNSLIEWFKKIHLRPLLKGLFGIY